MKLIINDEYKSLADILNATSVELDKNDSFYLKIEASRTILEEKIKEGVPIYGVTTGYGECGNNSLSPKEASALQQNLYRFHGCGVGAPLSEEESRLVIIVRLISLSKGASGVSFELLKALERLIEAKIYPVIPQQGSVGASGDLTPLSYLAALLAKEREAYHKQEIKTSEKAFDEEGLEAYRFKPKEALSIMNSTAVMSSIALIAIDRFEKALNSFMSFCAAFLEVMLADVSPLEPFVQNCKPFSGQISCAETLLLRTRGSKLIRSKQQRRVEFSKDKSVNIQDRYSIRCIPQVMGVAFENLEISKKWLEIEINSVSDNPLICCEEEEIYNGCNFYGGYVAHACDTLKIALCSVADLMDKQFASMVDEKLNRGLGSNLKLSQEPLFHGFKAMQITLSSLSADILSKIIPFSALSRPTESLNQDKVSMGTSSSISLKNAVEDFENMLSIALIGIAQAIEIRGVEKSSHHAKELFLKIREISPALQADRRLDTDIAAVKNKIRKGVFA